MCNFELNKDFIDSMQKRKKVGKFDFNKIKVFALEKDSLFSTLFGKIKNCM